MDPLSGIKALFGGALMLVSSHTILAQSAASTLIGIGGDVGTIFTGGGVPHGTLPVTFTATWKTTRLQKLADGTVTTHVSSVKAAQDSVGRSYRETHPELPNGAPPGFGFFVLVGDPIAHTTISWNSASQEAVVFHAPRQSPQPRQKPDVPAVHSESQQPAPPLPPPSDSPVKRLGPKLIHGKEATGTSFIAVYPPNSPGSDQPVTTVVEEHWYWTDPGVEVLRIVTDPRMGVSRTELVEFESGAPNEALFEIPPGYAVRDVYPEDKN